VLKFRRYAWCRALPFTLMFLCLSAWASAQAPAAQNAPGTPDMHHGQGYLFLAPGAYVGYSETIATMHFGGGGEAFLYRGLAAGVEVGGIWALRGSDLLAVFSADGSYHFSRSRKLSPFLACGYSRIWGDGSANMVNFGGGINWWLGERKGIRLEFRDHVYAGSGHRQIAEFRIGFAFR
jgi:hypothetical protein